MVILYIGDRGMAIPVVKKNPLIASIISHIETRLKKKYSVLFEIMLPFSVSCYVKVCIVFFSQYKNMNIHICDINVDP